MDLSSDVGDEVSLRLRLFGGVFVETPEGRLGGRAAHRRRIATLALLGASPTHRLPRERIVAYLWPEHSDEAGRRLLSESLYVLRKELGEDVITSASDQVELNMRRIRCDVAEFLAYLKEGKLERAVTTYAGPFMDAWFVSHAPDFDEWVSLRRLSLASDYARALQSLAERSTREKDWAAATTHWRALYDAEPVSDVVAQRLAELLIQTGERASALRLISAHEKRMETDLGISASAELLRLKQDLRRTVGVAGAELDTPPRAHASIEEAARTNLDGPAVAAPAEAPMVPTQGPVAFLRKWRPWLEGAVGALIVLGGLLWVQTGSTADAGRLDPRRVAVTYFDDLSSGGTLGDAASQLTEAVIRELATVDGFEVIPRGSVRPFRNGSATVDSIAQALRAGSVVEGTIRQMGDSARLSVNLVDATRGSLAVSTEMVRAVMDLASPNQPVARDVTDFLRRQIGARVADEHRLQATRYPRARQLVMDALRWRDIADSVARRRSGTGRPSALAALLTADSLFLKARTIDGGWAEPIRGRSDVALRRAALDTGAMRDTALVEAVRYAGEGLARWPDDPLVLESYGRAQLQLALRALSADSTSARLADAESRLRRAVLLDPQLASAWGQLSLVLVVRGRYAEAEVLAKRALEMDAYLRDAPDILHQLYVSAVMIPDLPVAARWCDRGRATYPDDIRFLDCKLTLLREDPANRGDPGVAWALVERLDLLDPPNAIHQVGDRNYLPVYRRMVAATLSAWAGDTARALSALRLGREATAEDPELALDFQYDEAIILTALGHRRDAVRRVANIAAARPALISVILQDALLAPLRSEREFRSLRRP